MSHVSAVHRLAGTLVCVLALGFSFSAARAQSGGELMLAKTVPPGQGPVIAVPQGACNSGFSNQPDPRNPHGYQCYTTNQIGTGSGTTAPEGLFGCKAPFKVLNSSPAVESNRFKYRCTKTSTAPGTGGTGGPCNYYPGFNNWSKVSNTLYICSSIIAAKCKAPYVLVSGSAFFKTSNRRFEYRCKHSQY